MEAMSRTSLRGLFAGSRDSGFFPLGVGMGMLCCFLAMGCQKEGPALYTVSGKVTFQGRTVPTGLVVFVPEEGKTSSSPIAEDGSYLLETISGKHRVGITAIPEPPPGIEDPMQYRSPPPLVPSRYNRPDQSGLVVEVKPSKENRIDLPLR